MENNHLPQLFRVIDVCSKLAMSRSAIYREIEQGRLKAIKRGASLRITSEELNRYVSSLPIKEV